MMWIVRLALRRPYTFVVFALLILILGVFSIESMPTDIFPNIDIPVVTIMWCYGGMSADQIANRIVTNAERSMTATVNDIDHGDGGEQNAPLGRAVIGGLLLATVATLFFVPAFFSFIHGRIERRRRRVQPAASAGVSSSFDEFD